MAAAHVAQKVAGRIELPMPEISVQREKSFSGVAAGVVLRSNQIGKLSRYTRHADYMLNHGRCFPAHLKLWSTHRMSMTTWMLWHCVSNEAGRPTSTKISIAADRHRIEIPYTDTGPAASGRLPRKRYQSKSKLHSQAQILENKYPPGSEMQRKKQDLP